MNDNLSGIFWRKRLLIALAIAALAPFLARGADDEQALYATPDDAVKGLQEAVKVRDTDATAMRKVFGPAAADLANPDPVQRAQNFQTFSQRLAEGTHLVKQDNGTYMLNLGKDNWPFPIPLAAKGDKWFFDTAAGKEEILRRRIGQNELSAIEVCHAYVQAQRDYALKDRGGEGIMEYAQKMKSTPGKKDGLYWEAKPDEEESPLGPLVSSAHSEGYGKQDGKQDETAPKVRQPFHGYFFKILTKQGKNAPAGKYDYIINGHMVAGFAFMAFPAQWNNSGVQTFIVNQQGKVFQKNLGENTAELVKDLTEYNPDETWTPAE